MYRKILSILLVCSTVNPMALAAKETAPISKRILIEENGPALVAYADLGAIDAGTTVKATLTLVNDSEFSFPILNMQTSCSCIKVTSAKSEIPAHGSLDFAFSVDVQRDAKTPELTMAFSVFYSETAAIEVYVKYQIAGLISFKNVLTYHTTATLGAKSHSFQIPVLVTEPVRLEQVELSVADSLKHLKIAAKEDADGQWLECVLPIDPAASDSLIGRIWMKHPQSAKLSEIALVIEINKPYSLAPSVLQFKRADIEKNVFEASGILRINSPSSDEASETENSPVNFEWRVDEGQLQCTEKKIADRIYRLHFSWRPDPQEAGKEPSLIQPAELTGRILSAEFKSDLSIPLVFGGQM